MKINICVGSCCHLKGSYDILQLMKEAIELHQLDTKVNLSAAFCLGHCTNGVSVKIDEDIIDSVSKDNFKDFFQKRVLERLSS
jgi:NADH:ubiquinone oxidoreductase subunit E